MLSSTYRMDRSALCLRGVLLAGTALWLTCSACPLAIGQARVSHGPADTPEDSASGRIFVAPLGSAVQGSLLEPLAMSTDADVAHALHDLSGLLWTAVLGACAFIKGAVVAVFSLVGLYVSIYALLCLLARPFNWCYELIACWHSWRCKVGEREAGREGRREGGREGNISEVGRNRVFLRAHNHDTVCCNRNASRRSSERQR
jgi:hypothetical protein